MNEDFKYIAAISEHGSISKAARAMHISQPGLSQRLRKLEAQLGTELFNRETYPLTPTPSGEVFVKYALKAIAAEDRMRREVIGVSSRHRMRLRIGVSSARANALLSEPVVAFYEMHRGCTLEFCEMSTLTQMHDLFVGDRIDFGMLTPMIPDPSLYDTEVICHERLVAVASEQLELPQLGTAGHANIHQLEGIPFVLPTCGSYYDPLISRVIDVSGVQLDIVVRDCTSELALGLVEEGLGICIVPSTAIVGKQGLKIIDIDDLKAGNALRYIRRGSKPISQEETLFVDIVKQQFLAG